MKKVITFKEYKEMINDPELSKYDKLPVVSSHDDEGNGYDRILYAPTLMENVDVYNDMGKKFEKAICINWYKDLYKVIQGFV